MTKRNKKIDRSPRYHINQAYQYLAFTVFAENIPSFKVDKAVGVQDVAVSVLLPHEVFHVIAEHGMSQAWFRKCIFRLLYFFPNPFLGWVYLENPSHK